MRWAQWRDVGAYGDGNETSMILKLLVVEIMVDGHVRGGRLIGRCDWGMNGATSVVLVNDEDTSVGGLRNVADDAFGIYVRIAWGFADE